MPRNREDNGNVSPNMMKDRNHDSKIHPSTDIKSLNSLIKESKNIPLIEEQEFKRPSCNYVELVSEAINSSPEGKLTVSQIYQWFVQNHPFFGKCQSNWKNSIRHLLSMNPHFKKVPRSKTESGKGSYWTLESNSKNFPMSFIHNENSIMPNGKLNMMQNIPNYMNCMPYVMPEFNSMNRYVNSRQMSSNYRSMPANESGIPSRSPGVNSFYSANQPLSISNHMYDSTFKRGYSMPTRETAGHSLRTTNIDQQQTFSQTVPSFLPTPHDVTLPNGNAPFNESAGQCNQFHNEMSLKNINNSYRRPSTAPETEMKRTNSYMGSSYQIPITDWSQIDLNSLTNVNRFSHNSSYPTYGGADHQNNLNTHRISKFNGETRKN